MTQNLIPLAQPANTPVTMSSLEISELTGKEHKNVIRDIRPMIQELASVDGSVLSHVREDKDARGYTAMFHLDRELTDSYGRDRGPVCRRFKAQTKKIPAGAVTPRRGTLEK